MTDPAAVSQHRVMAEKIGSVDEFLEMLDSPQRTQVMDLRRLILSVAPQLVEHIKWNSPSYVQDGVDRLTINVRNKQHAVQLILHMDTGRPETRNAAAVMTDRSGRVRWLSDIRGVIQLAPAESVEDMQAGLTKVIIDWLDVR